MANLKRVLDRIVTHHLMASSDLVVSGSGILPPAVDRDVEADLVMICRALDDRLLHADLVADMINAISTAMIGVIRERKHAKAVTSDIHEKVNAAKLAAAERKKLLSAADRLPSICLRVSAGIASDLVCASFLRDDLQRNRPPASHIANAKERRSKSPISFEEAGIERLIAAHLCIKIQDPRDPYAKKSGAKSKATDPAEVDATGIDTHAVEANVARRLEHPSFNKARAGKPLTPRETVVEIMARNR